MELSLFWDVGSGTSLSFQSLGSQNTTEREICSHLWITFLGNNFPTSLFYLCREFIFNSGKAARCYCSIFLGWTISSQRYSGMKGLLWLFSSCPFLLFSAHLLFFFPFVFSPLHFSHSPLLLCSSTTPFLNDLLSFSISVVNANYLDRCIMLTSEEHLLALRVSLSHITGPYVSSLSIRFQVSYRSHLSLFLYFPTSHLLIFPSPPSHLLSIRETSIWSSFIAWRCWKTHLWLESHMLSK